jgi:hypothetical protein
MIIADDLSLREPTEEEAKRLLTDAVEKGFSGGF